MLKVILTGGSRMLTPIFVGKFRGKSVKALCSVETVGSRIAYKIEGVSGVDMKIQQEIIEKVKHSLFFRLEAVRNHVRSRLAVVVNRSSLIKRLGYLFFFAR